MFLGAFTASGWAFPWENSYLAYLSLGALICLNSLYWIIGATRGYPLGDFYVHWLVDIALITVIVVGLGSPSLSAAISGYLLIVVSSAVFISGRASYIVATGAACAFLSLFVAEAYGWLTTDQGIQAQNNALGRQLFVTGGSIILMYLIAHIAGTLADQLNATNGLLSVKNSELIAKNQELERLHAELEFQAKVLTHDIRSPMSAVSAALAQISGGRESDQRDQRSLLSLVKENVDRVHDMIEALHQVQEVGFQTFAKEQFENVSLKEIWNDLMSEFGAAIERAKIVVSVDAEASTVYAVRSKLLILIRNLVMNAIRYVPRDGTGRICIGCKDSGGESHVFVRDNGSGVSREHRESIFEMFRKAPQSERSPGLGVGLALVRRIAEWHGGRAWVEASGDGGAVFRVSFPKNQAL